MDIEMIRNAMISLLSAFGPTTNDKNVTEGTIPLHKSVNNEKRMAMFVVLAPEVVDGQGDIYSVEEVEKACHNFNEFCGEANLFHQQQTSEIAIVESYIVPAAFQTEDGVVIEKGTWVQWMRFDNDTLWDMVKNGEICGASIGAYAKGETLND